jgi:deoxyribose-phosphate aldolase
MSAFTVETVTPARLAQAIDHSLLQPNLTLGEVDLGCEVAAHFATAAVCCRPADVARCRDNLAGTGVRLSTVIGFPHGSHLTATKVFESERAIDDGATELDMVLNIAHLRSGDAGFVEADIAAVCDAARARGALVKVIFENHFLSDEEKVAACRLSESAGAAYVKTSTGYAPTGATLPDLRLMRANVSAAVKLKAAGGVRSLDQFLDCLDAGCDRIGTSSTAVLVEELVKRRAELGLD